MATQGILHRIQERYSELRKSEKQVADYLRAHEAERLDMSITELSNTLDLSEATISRFTRALGYKGFADMKLALASESTPQNSVANLPAAMEEGDSLVEISHKLLSALSKTMSDTQKHLVYSDVQTVVRNMIDAQTVVFFGVGGAVSVCEEAVHLLLKAGIQATCHRDAYTQQVVAATITEKTMVIGISHTGTTSDVAKALEISRKRGAKTVAITSTPDSLVGRAAALTLSTWRQETPQIPLYGDFLEGRMCQLYIVYLLYIGVLFQSDGVAQEHLKATAESLSKHYQVAQ